MTRRSESGNGAPAGVDTAVKATAEPKPTRNSIPVARWLCIAIACNADHADELAAVVAERFAVGVEITADGIRFYLPHEADAAKNWEPELGAAFDEFRGLYGVDQPLSHTSHLVEDEGWGERWKEHFKPLRVGRHFIVCPTWEEPHAGKGDRVIRIDPGQAFGTGHHETTRLCLEWLEAYDDLLCRQDRDQTPPSRWPSLLDVGTGSGILAIGAALLGWHQIVAIDIDPEAVQVAAENLQLNGMNKSIRLATGDVCQVPERFDVVMANVQALPLIQMAEALKVKLNPRGHLVLSGILQEQRDMLVAAFTEQGLHLVAERPAGEWCLLELVPVPGGIDGSRP